MVRWQQAYQPCLGSGSQDRHLYPGILCAMHWPRSGMAGMQLLLLGCWTLTAIPFLGIC